MRAPPLLLAVLLALVFSVHDDAAVAASCVFGGAVPHASAGLVYHGEEQQPYQTNIVFLDQGPDDAAPTQKSAPAGGSMTPHDEYRLHAFAASPPAAGAPEMSEIGDKQQPPIAQPAQQDRGEACRSPLQNGIRVICTSLPFGLGRGMVADAAAVEALRPHAAAGPGQPAEGEGGHCEEEQRAQARQPSMPDTTTASIFDSESASMEEVCPHVTCYSRGCATTGDGGLVLGVPQVASPAPPRRPQAVASDSLSLDLPSSETRDGDETYESTGMTCESHSTLGAQSSECDPAQPRAGMGVHPPSTPSRYVKQVADAQACPATTPAEAEAAMRAPHHSGIHHGGTHHSGTPTTRETPSPYVKQVGDPHATSPPEIAHGHTGQTSTQRCVRWWRRLGPTQSTFREHETQDASAQGASADGVVVVEGGGRPGDVDELAKVALLLRIMLGECRSWGGEGERET